jgi:hypothetical protein
MSKKLSTAQLLPTCASMVCPGLGNPNNVPAVMRRRSKSGSPAIWPCSCPMSAEKNWGLVPGVRGALSITPVKTGTMIARLYPAYGPVPVMTRSSVAVKLFVSPPRLPPGMVDTCAIESIFKSI